MKEVGIGGELMNGNPPVLSPEKVKDTPNFTIRWRIAIENPDNVIRV